MTQTLYESDCLRVAITAAIQTPGYYNLSDEKRLLVVAKECLKAGVEMYAHWKDGVAFVGTGGKTLKEAHAAIDAVVPNGVCK